MRSIYDVPAPAKLNTFLHVTGRRADGYHLLQSVFVLIDWSDILHFELRADGVLSREDLGAPLPADDLVLRAARALQRHTGCPLGAHIGIEKRVPVQAGMGGGSSDAASCLLALNRLWRLGLPQPALEAIGLALGADVPFFLRGRNAWVEGVGEEITGLTGAARIVPTQLIVVKPAAGLDTGAIFSSELLKRNTPNATITGFAADPFGFGRNDLQPVAEALCPAVTQALEWLGRRGLRGRMTGSGSAVFARIPDDAAATVDVTGIPAGTMFRQCKSLEVHPLAQWASGSSRY